MPKLISYPIDLTPLKVQRKNTAKLIRNVDLNLMNRKCRNINCDNVFEVEKPSIPKVFCSRSCAAHVNNQITMRSNNGTNAKMSIKRACLYCGKVSGRQTYKYCSNQCQRNYQRDRFIENWKSGKISGEVGIEVKVTSSQIRKYLIEKFEEKCSICSWNQRNPVTNKVPIEVDHIDGDSSNNREDNLRLICPNCHSLSPNYKNLNKGKGRKWRMAKYIKTSSARSDLN